MDADLIDDTIATIEALEQRIQELQRENIRISVQARQQINNAHYLVDLAVQIIKGELACRCRHELAAAGKER